MKFIQKYPISKEDAIKIKKMMNGEEQKEEELFQQRTETDKAKE